MAQGSGIAAQLGLAVESTYGTRVAPARFLEFRSESLGVDIDRIESDALRANQRILRSDHWAPGKKSVSGDIEWEVGNKGFGILFKHMLGASASSASGTGFRYRATLADPIGLSFSIQVGKPGSAGVVHPFDFLGCVIPSWELSNAVDGQLMLNTSIDGRDLDTAQTLAVSPIPGLTDLFYFTQGVVQIGGSAAKVKDISIAGSVGYDTERYFVQTAGNLKSAPIQAEKVEITGSMTMEFENMTQLNRYLNGTVAAVVATWTGALTYDVALPFKVEVTLATVRFDGDVPDIGGPDILELTLPFKVLDVGSGEPIIIDYYTNDVAA